MDINNYYSRPGYQPAPQFQAPRQTQPITMDPARATSRSVGRYVPPSPPPQYDGGFDEQAYAAMTRANSTSFDPDSPTNMAIAEMQRREQMNRDALNRPPPAVGEIDPTTYAELNAIYYRYYLNGDYGSEAMMKEVRDTVEAYKRREEERKRLMAPTGYTTLPGQVMTAGTFVRPGDFVRPVVPPPVRPGTPAPSIGAGIGKPMPPRPTPILGGGLLPR